MFWKERVRSNREQNGYPPCGQVRVLVAGDSGVGKTSLIHLLVKGSAISRPSQTVGCKVEVRHIIYGNSGSSSSSTKGDMERDFFVELWDISGSERYKGCRSLFYKQINGVIFVHDLSQRRTKSSLIKWAAEIASTGTFSAPLTSVGPGGLPVPYLVVGNKTDIVAKDKRVSSGNLVDVARQWVEKQGLLPSSEELPLTESFPGSSSLESSATEAQYDKEAITKFFLMLIRRRYFADELPAPNAWLSYPVRSTNHSLGNSSSEDNQFHRNLGLNGGDTVKYDVLPPLPAQRNLPPPPTLYPQQPASVSAWAAAAGSSSQRRADINV